nr:unnamed protein product [Digitaria exilis]
MESTVLSVGKSVLDGALRYAKSAVAEEVSLQLGVRRDQAFIKDELEMMQAFLMSAHEERDEHRVVATWVKQVRDVAYDVEDCIQDFTVRLGKHCSWWRVPRVLIYRHRVSKQMKELRARVEDVSQRNARYQLIKGSSAASMANTAAGQPSSSMPSTSSATTMSAIDEERRRQNKAIFLLVRLISKTDDDLRVIAVWGASGVLDDNTPIVKMAYDYLKRNKKFECYAWVRIMHPFNPTEFLRNIIRQFYIDTLEDAATVQEESTPGAQDLRMMWMMKGDDLVNEFEKYVHTRSYMIVLCDISTLEEWDQIKACLPNNNRGSRLLVSTGVVEVASLCVGPGTVLPQHKQLSTNQALYAFYDKVFDNITDLDEHYPELVEEAKLILKKCNGLPLAIATIGGFLKKQPKTHMEWTKLNVHISSELEMNPELGMIKNVLLKSCDGLPYHLKSCFLYLSIFPAGYKVSRGRLIRRWSAEVEIDVTPNRHGVFNVCCCVMFPSLARRLDPHGVVLPTGIRKLKALDTLGAVNIAQGKTIIQDIRRLTQLRKLEATGINKENCQEFCLALSKLSCLTALSVSVVEPDSHGYLDGVSSPPKKLLSLRLLGSLVKLPEWTKELQNLVKLNLRRTKLSELDASIQVIGGLPNLTILCLWQKSFQVEELCLNFQQVIFPSLKVLELALLDNLKSVEFGAGGAMPKLEQIFYAGWQEKTDIVLFFGLAFLQSFKEFLLYNGDYKEDFIEDVKAQLAKNPNGPVLKRYSVT